MNQKVLSLLIACFQRVSRHLTECWRTVTVARGRFTWHIDRSACLSWAIAPWGSAELWGWFISVILPRVSECKKVTQRTAALIRSTLTEVDGLHKKPTNTFNTATDWQQVWQNSYAPETLTNRCVGSNMVKYEYECPKLIYMNYTSRKSSYSYYSTLSSTFFFLFVKYFLIQLHNIEFHII